MHLLCCRRTKPLKLPVLSSLAGVHCKITEPLQFLFFRFVCVEGRANFIISFMVMGFPYFLKYILDSFSLEIY